MSARKDGDTNKEGKAELQAMGFEPVPILRAIRAKCLECSGGSHTEVADCLVKTCALYPFRMGRNPWRVEVSRSQREASRRNAAKLKRPVKITESDETEGAAVSGSLPNPPNWTA
jgi:hypothetical protein